MTLGWDANGNLISKSGANGVTYSWDFENRLTGVTLADGAQVNHAYDPDGVRVKTEVTPAGGGSSVVTDYLNDTSGFLSHVVVESVAGVATVAYTRADDRLVSLYRPVSGSSWYFHADGLGSVRLLTDGAGVVTDSYAYTAFGVGISHSGADVQPYQFAGEAFDPNSGFYYNRARWLDVGAGRFAGVDPFSGLDQTPVTLNRYLYAGADPANIVDPSGLFGVSGALASVSLVGAISLGGFFSLGPLGPRPLPAGQSAATSVSAKGIAFISQWEAFRSRLYNDIAGHCTIGWGHLVHLGNCNGSEPANFKAGISRSEADKLLKADVSIAEKSVNKLVKVPIAQYEFDAVSSWMFNLGETSATRNSTLLKRLNLKQRLLVPLEFHRWNKARVNGKLVVSQGLVNRRRAEARLFSTGVY